MKSMRDRLIAELRIMDLNELKPNYSELARKYGLDYRTVKKYHLGYEGKPKTRDKPSKLDKFHIEIESKLQIPRVTLKGVYEWLVDNYGYQEIGSYSNFKTYCKKNNLSTSKRMNGGNTRYESNPGDLAQCDWKENILLTSKYGEIFTINIFHVVMKFSRYSYIELSLSKEQSTVMRCLINSFRYFGGIPNRLLFDNMSSVVDINVKPKRVNARMTQFSKDFNFKIELCKPRHPYTKGTNEARNKMLDWIRAYNDEFETIEELQIIVDKINTKMNIEECEGTNLPPSVLFCKEKEYLNPLPNNDVVNSYLTPSKVKVSQQQLVTHNGIKYSVDKKYINEFVNIEEFNDILQIYYKGKLIQIHHVSKNPINYTSNHYEQSLGKTIKAENIEEVARKNLLIMNQLLENRTVTITKQDAMNSNEELLAYLISHGSLSNWIKRFIKTLDINERKVLFDEIRKILPYIEDEEQFFLAFKHAASKQELNLIRFNFWMLDFSENYTFLTKDGYEMIYKEFEVKIKKYINEFK